jgi:hypothetical protein
MRAVQAAKIAVDTVRETLDRLSCQMEVTFCCFSERDRGIYSVLLAKKDLDD